MEMWLNLKYNMTNYWLLKTDAGCYNIDDLEKDNATSWTGIRNYQARNYIRAMKKGDKALFYHSSCAEPAIVGIAKIESEAYPDPTQFDQKDEHFDAKSKKEAPMWSTIDIVFLKKLEKPITLFNIKQKKQLDGMIIAQKGNRLSVTPVSLQNYNFIVNTKLNK
jgi:predicted RNA-binding protein with PUA-like domain